MKPSISVSALSGDERSFPKPLNISRIDHHRLIIITYLLILIEGADVSLSVHHRRRKLAPRFFRKMHPMILTTQILVDVLWLPWLPNGELTFLGQ